MSRRRLLASVDLARIRSAIEQAERGTSGEVRVSLAAPFWGDAHKAAQRVFARLGMYRTDLRNAVLILVIPSRRRFVIVGDVGIDAKVGQVFWEALSETLGERFRFGDFTGGLVQSIEAIGGELRRHFPAEGPADVSTLADDVDLDG